MKIEQRIRFWYLRFVRLSNQNDELQTEIERLRKIVDKNASEIVEIIQELKQLKEQSEEMTFDNVVLGQ